MEFLAHQQRKKEMRTRENEKKSSFDKLVAKITDLEVQLVTLMIEKMKILKKSKVMALEFQQAISKSKAIGKSLANQKEVILKWKKQEHEALTTKKKCLDI